MSEYLFTDTQDQSLKNVVSVLGLNWEDLKSNLVMRPLTELVILFATQLRSGASSIEQIKQEVRMLSAHPQFGHFISSDILDSVDTSPEIERRQTGAIRLNTRKNDKALMYYLFNTPHGDIVNSVTQRVVAEANDLVGMSNFLHPSDLTQPKLGGSGRGYSFTGAELISRHMQIGPTTLGFAMSLTVEALIQNPSREQDTLSHLVGPLIQFADIVGKYGHEPVRIAVLDSTRMAVNPRFVNLRNKNSSCS